jgi:hypothetical protein
MILNFGLLKNSGSVNARDDFSTFLELMGYLMGMADTALK